MCCALCMRVSCVVVCRGLCAVWRVLWVAACVCALCVARAVLCVCLLGGEGEGKGDGGSKYVCMACDAVRAVLCGA